MEEEYDLRKIIIVQKLIRGTINNNKILIFVSYN